MIKTDYFIYADHDCKKEAKGSAQKVYYDGVQEKTVSCCCPVLVVESDIAKQFWRSVSGVHHNHVLKSSIIYLLIGGHELPSALYTYHLGV